MVESTTKALRGWRDRLRTGCTGAPPRTRMLLQPVVCKSKPLVNNAIKTASPSKIKPPCGSITHLPVLPAHLIPLFKTVSNRVHVGHRNGSACVPEAAVTLTAEPPAPYLAGRC
jgi:hypothetical protein